MEPNQYIRILGIVGFLLICGCGGAPSGETQTTGTVIYCSETSQDERLRVVVTVGMLADLVREVAGDQVTVIQLMGPGVDPHLYQPTRHDIRALTHADIVFYNGLMLEGKLTKSCKRLSNQKTVVAVAEFLPVEKLVMHQKQIDPHVWLDVELWSHGLDVIVNTFARFSSLDQDRIAKNAARYRQKLLELHDYGRRVMASIPDERRVLVSAHDAFGYFGRAYGLEVVGVQGISTESEPGLHRVNHLVDNLIENRIPAVFFESSVPSKSLDALVSGAHSRQHTVELLGPLFSDAAGASGTYEGTYLGMMDHNFTLIAFGLGGDATPTGWQNKLKSAQKTAATEHLNHDAN